MRNGIDLIKQFEGLRLDAYLCPADKWTIGWGATFYEGNIPVKQGDKISQERAEELIKFHYDSFEQKVKALVKVPLTENQLGALVSFAFNLGVGNLSSSTLLKKLNTKDYSGAAAEFPKWNRANGKVLDGLTKRRMAEQTLFLKSDVADNGKPLGLVKLVTNLLGK